MSEVGWQEDHASDFFAIHEALHAIAHVNLASATHTDWLVTVRTVREKVQDFSFFIPNGPALIDLLNTIEKVLLAVQAVENLSKDA